MRGMCGVKTKVDVGDVLICRNGIGEVVREVRSTVGYG